MLIACKNFCDFRMDILILLVVAMFVITGAYVGYNASQQPSAAEGHNYNGADTLGAEFEALKGDLGLVQILQNPGLSAKAI